MPTEQEKRAIRWSRVIAHGLAGASALLLWLGGMAIGLPEGETGLIVFFGLMTYAALYQSLCGKDSETGLGSP